MQAIITKYRGPSNTHGARIFAKCDAGSLSVPYPHELPADRAHQLAANALRRKLGWLPAPNNLYGDLVSGEIPGGYVHVDDGMRLRALKGIVNSMRDATWSGSPWGHAEFRNCAAVIGQAHDYHGDPLNAPTRPDEIQAWENRHG